MGGRRWAWPGAAASTAPGSPDLLSGHWNEGLSVSQLAVNSGCNGLGVRDCGRSLWSPQSWPGPGTEELGALPWRWAPFSGPLQLPLREGHGTVRPQDDGGPRGDCT